MKWQLKSAALLACVGGLTLLAPPDRVMAEHEAGHRTAGQAPRQHEDFSSRELCSASKAIGMNVRTSDGQTPAKIHDIVLDSGRTKASYAIVSVGGVLGVGDRLAAVPWQALKADPGGDFVTLNVDKATLERQPALKRDAWPSMTDREWRRQTNEVYGVSFDDQRTIDSNADNNATATQDQAARINQPDDPQTAPLADEFTRHRTGHVMFETEGETEAYTDTRTGETMYRPKPLTTRLASDLIGMEVTGQDGKELATLEDLLIDKTSGRVVYGVLDYGGALGINQKRAAVPIELLKLAPDRQAVQFRGNASRLESARLNKDDASPFLRANAEERRRIDAEFQNDVRESNWYFLGGGMARTDADTGNAWAKNDSEYNRRYQAGSEVTVQGTVDSVGAFYPDDTASQGLRLRVKADDGRIVTVHAGPRDALRNMNLNINRGDRVTVVGSRVAIDNREVIMARQIRTSDQTFDVRSSQGAPLWRQDTARQAGVDVE